GELTINVATPGKDAGYAEVIVSLKDKSEGALQVTRLDFKDADGTIVLSHGAASEAAAPAATDAPKTGVESFGLIFGLGAAVLGSGAVVLKKKEK
ncbi:MAG TPA: LPXTG cell wall anchor domain-containing protein, partial [Mobilitalea sp.]|nr:LPXTG cell wall anchor domain-containing protein [Mobilitalea sp.]